MWCPTWLCAEVCIAQHRSQVIRKQGRKGMKMFADNTELVRVIQTGDDGRLTEELLTT